MSQRSPSYGWVVVAASAAIICIGMGALFSLGVFLVPIERATGWSRGAISTVALLNWMAMGVGSFVWGALSDRIGGRGVALAGGVLLGLGLVLASQAQALWQLHASFGVLVGFAVGAFYAPLTSTVTKWFSARRGLAVALVSSGIGLGILLISPLARALTSAWDWRIAMLVLGDLAWLALQAGMIAAYLVARELWSFYALALVFGLAYGGVMPLYALLTRDFFGEKVMGTAYGAVFLISSLGMGLGSLAGGVIHDRLGAYAWLYVGSAALAFAAVVVAFTFRRPAALG